MSARGQFKAYWNLVTDLAKESLTVKRLFRDPEKKPTLNIKDNFQSINLKVVHGHTAKSVYIIQKQTHSNILVTFYFAEKNSGQ